MGPPCDVMSGRSGKKERGKRLQRRRVLRSWDATCDGRIAKRKKGEQSCLEVSLANGAGGR